MRNYILFLILSFIVMAKPHLFSQAPDIKHIPSQNHSQSIRESTPVVISDSEILVFYASEDKDTIFSTRTTNGGTTWLETEYIISGYKSSNSTEETIYLSSLRTTSGRIILSWTKWREGMILIYSDDNGYTWSVTQLVLGGGSVIPLQRTSLYNLNLSDLNNDKLILSFNTESGSRSFYRESLNDGETWSEEAFVFYESANSTNGFRDVSMTSYSNNEVTAFFEDNKGDDTGIYKRMSADGGQTWTDEILVIDSPESEKRPRIIETAEQELWLVYQIEETLHLNPGYIHTHNDIYFSRSTDNGINWSDSERLTSYIEEDYFISGTVLEDKPFITFSSKRFTNKDQISYAIPGTTVEVYRPPFIVDVKTKAGEPDELANYIISRVIDDTKIKMVKVFAGDFHEIELFDDGKHIDGDSADYVYAGKILQEDVPATDYAYMSTNKIILSTNNRGTLASVQGGYLFNARFEATDTENNLTELSTEIGVGFWPFGRFDEGIFLYSGGFMINGYTDNLLWASGQMSSNLVENYLPGKVDWNPDDPKNLVYFLRADDTPFGDSWQQWRDAVSLGADFYDGDNDGIYDPVDKNHNQIWDPNEDMPDLLGDQTAWCVYNDGQPGNERTRFAGVEPQGIEIHQTLFAAKDLELENVIFFRYKIINRGTVADVLDSVIFSFFSDPDLGDHENDLVGCDSTLNSSICYNNNGDDIYGENPPAFFITLLQGPLANSSNPSDIGYNRRGTILGTENFSGAINQRISAFTNYMSSNPQRGDPNDEIEARNYSLGLNKLGLELDPCNDSWGEVRGGVDCSEINPRLWYSGDPVQDIGWLFSIATDQRDLLSVGEFTLEKDKPVIIIGAYVLGRGSDAINSITVARENVQRAIEEYNNNFNSLSYDPGEPKFTVTDYFLYQNYPNPFNPVTTIRYEIPEDGVVTIKIYDILGQEVRTVLNEFKKANRYEIDFNAAGLASGIYLYRMQVNNQFKSKKMILLR